LDIEAKTDDNTPIIIKGVATLPLSDFKFFTQSRFAAKWLLEHKHKWTHLCDSSLITPGYCPFNDDFLHPFQSIINLGIMQRK
jgi:hypothetical protein